MNGLKVYTPSVYYNNSTSPVEIFNRGGLFYIARPKSLFQLPKGVYSLNSSSIEFKKEFKREFKPYRPEYFKPLPKFEVHRVKNPHKASVFFDGNVFLDESFFDVEQPIIKRAVLYHEEAHQFYKTEAKCDHYAKERLLCLGYNPSQVYAAFKSTGLSGDRICKLKQHLKNDHRQ